jgi:hypothetical protein
MVSIDDQLRVIEKELLSLAKKERELLLKQKHLRCEKTHACDVLDLINNVQIG